MFATRKTRTVVYVSSAVATMALIAGGAAIALTRGSDPASAQGAGTRSANAVGGSTTMPTPGPSITVRIPAATPSSTASTAAVAVPPLHRLTPPDVVVTLRHSASATAVVKLRRIAGIRHVAIAARGRITLHGKKLSVLGVPLDSIRGFTPSLTASSTALWESVARGEVTVSYANSKGLRHDLGGTYDATGPGARVAPLRVGAFATLGLPGAAAIVSEPTAQKLGLAPNRVALIEAPKISLDALRSDIRKTLGTQVDIHVTRAATVNQAISSAYAQANIPAYYLDLYRRAAVTCPGLPWTVLAGIGTVETGNGRDVHTSSAGAEGPMQFIPSTWAMYGYDADGDGKADINDPVDAVFSAARYLCAAGAGRGGQSLDDAIYSYNHAWWYVKEVVVLANEYA